DAVDVEAAARAALSGRGSAAAKAGDDPERLDTEDWFTALPGVSPTEASSGKDQRRGLNHDVAREIYSPLRPDSTSTTTHSNSRRITAGHPSEHPSAVPVHHLWTQ